MERIRIFKSKYKWDKKRPWKISKGDMIASFRTKQQATKFRSEIRKYYLDPITFGLKRKYYKDGNL